MAGNELATAYLTLVPSLKGAQKTIERELDAAGLKKVGEKEGEKLGDGVAKTAGAKLKSGLKTAAAAAGVLAASAFAGAFAIGRQALDAYADYEQLVGGVETLFKESSGQLQAYAAEAYRTAGLSANQYMELSVSFSASLLQSLGGDTAKAADYANKAITDMSDNANKMGMDIERIQDAYRGFARGQFTMLDNLSLGYSGSREEMERLLADAEKISGIEYDISSYADIVDAIHVIQTEMGITGTTAAEAAATISGSVAMAKAAWQNWLVSIADENANLEETTSNLVNSIVTAASNIVPRIAQIVSALGPAVMEGLRQLYDQIINSFSTDGAAIGEAALSAFGAIASALAEIAPKVLAMLGLFLASIVVAIVQKGAEMVAQAGAVAGNVASEIGRGISEGLQRIKAKISGFVQAGRDMVAGIARGISSAAGEVWNAITRICQNSLNRIKSFFGIASPSKVMREMFGYVGEGMVLGLNDKAASVVGAMQGIANDTMAAASFSATPQLATAGAGVGAGSTTINLYCDIKDLQGIQTLNDLYDALARARAINPTRR